MRTDVLGMRHVNMGLGIVIECVHNMIFADTEVKVICVQVCDLFSSKKKKSKKENNIMKSGQFISHNETEGCGCLFRC